MTLRTDAKKKGFTKFLEKEWGVVRVVLKWKSWRTTEIGRFFRDGTMGIPEAHSEQSVAL